MAVHAVGGESYPEGRRWGQEDVEWVARGPVDPGYGTIRVRLFLRWLGVIGASITSVPFRSYVFLMMLFIDDINSQWTGSQPCAKDLAWSLLSVKKLCLSLELL